MVDPRIYRAGLAIVALAVIVFAFSLQNQPSPVSTTLAPPVTTTSAPYDLLQSLADRYPNRQPGSLGDEGLADAVAAQLHSDNLLVQRQSFEANTAGGRRQITTVIGSKVGLAPGAIVVVAHRDAAASPSPADLSGTVALLGIARALSGQTLNHPLLLVSTSGSVGAAGATALARTLSAQPIDAVIVLGDLAAADPTRPILIPWSNSPVIAPPVLRLTVAGYAGVLSGIPTGGDSLLAQFSHLAFPLTTGEQGPFGRQGIPAVLLSLSGNRPPARQEAVSAAHLAALQSAVVEAVSALDSAPSVPAPSAYLELNGQIVPLWAVRLLVLALLVPVGVACIDALARARRRGHSILRWLGWVLAGALPFLVVLAALLIVRVAGLLPASPPGPLPAGGVPLRAAGIAVLVIVGLLLIGAFVLLRPLGTRLAARIGEPGRRPSSPGADAAATAVILVMSVLALVAWVFNPFTAALLVPALHLWLWLAQPGVRARRPAALALALLGLAPVLLVVTYYAHSLGLSPVDVLWNGVQLVAGGQVTSVVGIFWALVAGSAVSVLIVGLKAAPPPPAATATAPRAIRGPATYAGPGSLGGTKSALGSRR